jgi:predicted DNA-binding transcriptional regulator YafY
MRSERLLALLQALRRRRRPVSAQVLAEELEISVRTLYRDVASLRAQGAPIDGEPGVGYVLKPSFFLPPLMLSQHETEALMLGMRWVSTFADRSLAAAADDALAKIEAVLPKEVRDGASAMPLRVGPPPQADTEDLSDLRDAIARECKLAIRYRDLRGRVSERIVWPFALGYFADGRILVAWCEQSAGYRHFRTDRLESRKLLARYPRRRAELFRAWQRSQRSREPRRDD